MERVLRHPIPATDERTNQRDDYDREGVSLLPEFLISPEPDLNGMMLDNDFEQVIPMSAV
jgi:hypothetical protein